MLPMRQLYDIIVGLQKSIVRDLQIVGCSDKYIQDRVVDKLQLIIKYSGNLGKLVENERNYNEIIHLKSENKRLKGLLKSNGIEV